LIFDQQNRPATVEDNLSGAKQVFFYPSATSMLIANYGSSGLLLRVDVVWQESGRLFAGNLAAIDSAVAEATNVVEITIQVAEQAARLRSAQQVSLSRRLFDLIPVGSAHAEDFTTEAMRKIITASVLLILNVVFPGLLAWAVVMLIFPGLPALATTVGAMVGLLILTFQSQPAGAAEAQIAALAEEYVTRPYRGNLLISGDLHITSGLGISRVHGRLENCRLNHGSLAARQFRGGLHYRHRLYHRVLLSQRS
jgi:hypothetical protein